jgi:hypothetical protein
VVVALVLEDRLALLHHLPLLPRHGSTAYTRSKVSSAGSLMGPEQNAGLARPLLALLAPIAADVPSQTEEANSGTIALSILPGHHR